MRDVQVPIGFKQGSGMFAVCTGSRHHKALINCLVVNPEGCHDSSEVSRPLIRAMMFEACSECVHQCDSITMATTAEALRSTIKKSFSQKGLLVHQEEKLVFLLCVRGELSREDEACERKHIPCLVSNRRDEAGG